MFTYHSSTITIVHWCLKKLDVIKNDALFKGASHTHKHTHAQLLLLFCCHAINSSHVWLYIKARQHKHVNFCTIKWSLDITNFIVHEDKWMEQLSRKLTNVIDKMGEIDDFFFKKRNDTVLTVWGDSNIKNLIFRNQKQLGHIFGKKTTMKQFSIALM